jgi:hypothetical protein
MSEVTHRPTRRLVLLGAAAVSLAACTGDDRPPPTTEGSPSLPEPDALLRGDVAEAERELLALHRATVSTHPALAAQLAPFSARHRRHLEAVEASGPMATPAPTSASAPGTGPPGTPSTAPTPVAPPAVPADPAQALTALRAAERAAADARVADCLRSEDPELAELLAAVAACEAAHDVVLGKAS